MIMVTVCVITYNHEKYIRQCLNSIVEQKTNFKFEEDMPIGVLSRALNNSRANEVLGWTPKFTLEDGLKKTIDWFVKTHKKTDHVDKTILLEHS